MTSPTETKPVVEVRFMLSGLGRSSKIVQRHSREGRTSKALVEDLITKAIEQGGVWSDTAFCPWSFIARVEWRLDEWNEDEKQQQESLRHAAPEPSKLLGR